MKDEGLHSACSRSWCILWVASLAALSVACAGTETGNGMEVKRQLTKVELKLTDADAPQDAPTYGGADLDGAPLVVSEAWAHFERLTLRLAEGASCRALMPDPPTGDTLAYTPRCAEDDDRITIDGPWWVDLMTGETTPPLDTVELPVGDYTRVDLRLRPERVPGAVGREGASTVVARGELELDGEPAPFELNLDFTAPMRFDGAVMVSDGLEAVLLLLDVRAWFDGLPFAACAAAGLLGQSDDGTLQLHQGQGPCAAAASLLTVAIRGSGHLTGGGSD